MYIWLTFQGQEFKIQMICQSLELLYHTSSFNYTNFATFVNRYWIEWHSPWLTKCKLIQLLFLPVWPLLVILISFGLSWKFSSFSLGNTFLVTCSESMLMGLWCLPEHSPYSSPQCEGPKKGWNDSLLTRNWHVVKSHRIKQSITN